jgi:carbon-monoxide dehydrogenase medium subunit
MNDVHTGLPKFDYIKPSTFKEASNFIIDHQEESRPFLGGTVVFVRLRDGIWKDKFLVDIKHLEGMRDISFDPKEGLSIGAAVTLNQIAGNPDIIKHYPLLIDAANSVGNYQLRNRATIGGSICNSRPDSDTVTACLPYDASLWIYGEKEEFETPMTKFFLNLGKSILKPGELLMKIKFPIPPAGAVGKFIKLGRNRVGDRAIVGVAVLGYPDQSVPSGFNFRIAIASAGPVPLIPKEAEQILQSSKLDEGIIEKASNAAMAAATPIDDKRASSQYRKWMVRNLTRKALLEVVEQLKGSKV